MGSLLLFLLLPQGVTFVYASPLASTNLSIFSHTCGVTRYPNGIYHFSRLHIEQNHVVDEHNCLVYLRGFNTAGLEDGNATGGGLNAAYFQHYSQIFQMNLWRLTINTTWWNRDDSVPTLHIKYRNWIHQVIAWMEQSGSYVEINKGPQFDEPPCGGNITFCTSQNTGTLEYLGNPQSGDPDPNDPDAVHETSDGRSIGPAITLWSQIAPLYKDDPAILYDSWNEGHALAHENPQQWQRNENKIIQTIRKDAPRSLIITPIGRDDMSGNLHYRQRNIVYDFHVYPSSGNAQDWPHHVDALLNYAYHDGNGVFFNEWGGNGNRNPYNDNLILYAIRNNVAIAFYEASTIFTNTHLNKLGNLVRSGYAMMPHGGQGLFVRE